MKFITSYSASFFNVYAMEFNSCNVAFICWSEESCPLKVSVEDVILSDILFTEVLILVKVLFISFIELLLELDSFLISLATTEKPFPHSPALEASIAALSPSKFV